MERRILAYSNLLLSPKLTPLTVFKFLEYLLLFYTAKKSSFISASVND
ncbi:MAG: hypothetical protein ACPKQO_00405 [Nitrososphaeraceae archaeon]